MWLALQLWNGGARRDPASVSGREGVSLIRLQAGVPSFVAGGSGAEPPYHFLPAAARDDSEEDRHAWATPLRATGRGNACNDSHGNASQHEGHPEGEGCWCREAESVLDLRPTRAERTSRQPRANQDQREEGGNEQERKAQSVQIRPALRGPKRRNPLFGERRPRGVAVLFHERQPRLELSLRVVRQLKLRGLVAKQAKFLPAHHNCA